MDHCKLSSYPVLHILKVIVQDNEPPTIQEFQDGFTWPYFVLSQSVLSDVGLSPPLIVQQYRAGLGTWLNVKAGHVIMVAEGDRIFLKASQVKRYPDFDTHLNMGAKSNLIHLRYNLPSKRADVRKKILKQKTAMLNHTTSKSLARLSTSPENDDSTPPPPSRLMNKTKPLSHRKTASSMAPSHESVASSSRRTTNISHEVVELTDESDDDPVPSRKRKPSNEIFLSAWPGQKRCQLLANAV